jgi:hypothetical protein
MLKLTISCLLVANAVLATPALAGVKQIKVKDSAFSEACANDRGRPGQCISQGSGGTGQGTYNQYEVCTQTSGTWSCHTVRCPTGNRGNCIVVTNNNPAKAVTVVKRYLDGSRNEQAGANTPKSPGSNSSGSGASGSGQSGGSSATVAGGGHAIGGGCSGGVC